MNYKRYTPASGLEKIIECYWIAENDDPRPQQQKIIPDGFCEIIFHYGDPFRIKFSNEWQQQSRQLLAGQITRHFFLENSGRAGVVGIKLKPTALTHLFNLDMHVLTDRVADLVQATGDQFATLQEVIYQCKDHEQWVVHFDRFFLNLVQQYAMGEAPVEGAVNLILTRKGLVSVAEMGSAVGLGERQLERLFKKYVGVSPKLYARIIRFSTIFQLIEQNDQSWAGLACESGFFDQSHFIRNFKAFTGEDPSRYSFDEQNMANFFLKK